MKAFLYGAPIRVFLLASWLILMSLIVSAQMDHTHSPATVEDCTKLSPALQAVVAVEPSGQKLEVALQPLSKVELIGKKESVPADSGREGAMGQRSLSGQTPGREGAMEAKMKPRKSMENVFAGFVRLTVPKNGMYRISADRTLWLEVIDGEKPIERVRIAPRLHCGRIQKSLGFPLKQERSYWLEVSGSKRPDVAVIITKEE